MSERILVSMPGEIVDPNCPHPQRRSTIFARDNGGYAFNCSLCGLRYYVTGTKQRGTEAKEQNG